MEKQIAVLTKQIHPQDLGKETGELENIIRAAFERLLNEFSEYCHTRYLGTTQEDGKDFYHYDCRQGTTIDRYMGNCYGEWKMLRWSYCLYYEL